MAREVAQPTSNTRPGTAAAVVAVVFWGLGNVLVKYIRLPGLTLALYRLALGSLVYWVVLRATGGRLSWRTVRLAIPGGIAFGLDMAFFFVSLKHTSVADASVITALQPALVFLVAGRLFAEHLSGRMIGWTAVAVVGVVIAVVGSASGAGRTLFGDLAAAASLVAWSYYFVAAKQARRQLSALDYQVGLSIVATAIIAPFALLHPSSLRVPDGATVGWVMVMVCIPGGGHLLMNWAHRYCSISLASTLTLGIPVVGVAGAAVVLGEPVTAVQLGGIALALVALGLILGRPPRRLLAGASEPLE
ncbi:MAG TPA: DMT family transporter [Acidimicrobiales bacterium]|nr:DMT family transporter [Acidimicrobiales bacterium]